VKLRSVITGRVGHTVLLGLLALAIVAASVLGAFPGLLQLF
jgi:hypothetical protein